MVEGVDWRKTTITAVIVSKYFGSEDYGFKRELPLNSRLILFTGLVSSGLVSGA